MSTPNKINQDRSSKAKRSGWTRSGVIASVVVVIALPIAVYAFVPSIHLPWKKAVEKPLTVEVVRGRFVHDLTERGDIESDSNVEIKCEVESKGNNGATILQIVPEGTWVEEGEVVCVLDSSALEDEKTKQEMAVANAKAALIQAQNAYDTAVIAKREYLEGQYRQQYLAAQIAVFVAEENKRRAEDYLKYSRSLAQKGYITEAQLEADQFALEKAIKELESAQTELEVLEKFTREKNVRQLEADIQTTEAKLESQQHAYDLEVEQLEYINEQIAKCTITSPAAGQVVYANRMGVRGQSDIIIEEGTRVREEQVIIRLPDPDSMQVKSKVNEAKIGLVKPGTPAFVRVEALDGVELRGEVVEVGKYPMPTSWFNSNVKEYEVTVKITNTVEGMRPGLTAEVRVRVEDLPDVLMVPVHAVFEHQNQTYCILYENGRLIPAPVEIGSTNDKVVVIESGLEEGQEVVQNAARFREDVGMEDNPEKDNGMAEQEQEASPETGGTGERPGGPPAGPGGPRGPGGPGGRGTPGGPGEQAGPAEGGPAGNGPGADGMPDLGAIVDRLFDTLDSNGDSKIAEDEIPADRRQKMMKGDTNGDGALDKSELRAAISSRAGGGPAVPPGTRRAGPGERPNGGE